jgi:hypothetical protein
MTLDVSARRPPLTVALFVAVVVAVLLYVLVASGVDGWLVGAGALLLASYGRARGVWIAWLFLVVVAVGDSIAAGFAGPAWLPLAVNLTLLALLVAPSTLRHITPPRVLARRQRHGR